MQRNQFSIPQPWFPIFFSFTAFRAGLVACAALLLLAACSNSNNPSGYSVVAQDHAVGVTSMVFVDRSRSTSAHGPVPEAPTRAIETTIVYPTEGAPGGPPSSGALADLSAAPHPLVILSHGLGGSVELLIPLAQVWAAKGYIVALPRFPLTSISTPGGPLGEDIQNQPADVSFVIDQILDNSATPGSLLNNAVDRNRIAAAGHSNGGITTYGLVAHSCCRDPRINAAMILSGTTSPFANGAYNLLDAPPLLIIHAINDEFFFYNSIVSTYNELSPPKGLLTLEESGHVSYFRPEDPAFDVTAIATTYFLEGVFGGDFAALEQLSRDEAPGVATLHWASDEATNIPLPLPPAPETNRQASLSESDNLVDGQVITVSWSGFLPEKVNIMQCTGDVTGGAAACNISGGTIFLPNPTGMGSHEQVIRTGVVGNGVCDAANPCTVIVNDAGLTEEDAIVRIPITFAH